MKKIIMILVTLLFVSLCSSAQERKTYKEIGKEWQEDYANTMRDFSQQTKNIPYNDASLNVLKEIIADYNLETNNDRKQILISHISLRCKESRDFLEYVIKNDTSETVRLSSIRALILIDAKESIPFLLEYVKKHTLSNFEKVKIAQALIIMQENNKGEKLLNDNCYVQDPDICYACIWPYYILGDKSSIKYYKYIINNTTDEINQNIAAQKLVVLGEYEYAYPMIEKLINDEKTLKLGLLRVLEIVNDEKAIRLVKKVVNDKDEKTQKEAIKILKNTNIKSDE